jgi:hypothetical protein
VAVTLVVGGLVDVDSDGPSEVEVSEADVCVNGSVRVGRTICRAGVSATG